MTRNDELQCLGRRRMSSSHPISFERVRNTTDWTDYFLVGDFSVKALSEEGPRYQELSERWRRPRQPLLDDSLRA